MTHSHLLMADLLGWAPARFGECDTHFTVTGVTGDPEETERLIAEYSGIVAADGC